MRSFQRTGHLWLVVVSVSMWAAAGCIKADRFASSTTGANTNTTVPTSSSDFTPLPGKDASTPRETAGSKTGGGTGVSAAVTPNPNIDWGKVVEVEIELPAPAFRGTPVPLKEPNVEPPRGKPRGPFFAPEGTVNLARGKPVRCSDPTPPAGELDYVTDGDKEASDFGYLELRPGSQWVQIDLQQPATIFAVVVWHNHAEARVYRDVIVQVSDEPDFLDPKTVFNNDYDNSSGQGIGADKGYVETSEGKLIDCGGVTGRYVRLWSMGNHIDGNNHYTEVEVYGKPAS